MENANNLAEKTYRPRNVLLIVEQGEATYARQLAGMMNQQGVGVYVRHDLESGINCLKSHCVDALVVGEGYEPLVEHIENHPEYRGIMTILTSENTAKADIRLPRTDLQDYLKEGLLIQHYMHNDQAQKTRKDEQELFSSMEVLLNAA